jgi:7-cyano-7-deazaguanine synthase
LRELFSGSALTDGGTIPNGHYADASMSATVVPNRNAVMLALAYAAAVSQSAYAVAIGVHAGDHPVYSDCRPEFIDAFDVMERAATDKQIELLSPFVNKTKSEIVKIGFSLGIDYARTWSCYNGRIKHCGECGTCVERKEAFLLANIQDPTEYE